MTDIPKYATLNNVLTPFRGPKDDVSAWRALVLGVEGHNLGRDVGVGPQVVHVARTDLPPVPVAGSARFRFPVNNAVLPHRAHISSRPPELDLE